MELEPASPMDEPWIRQLLILCGLPEEDITPEHLRHFWVLKGKGRVVGVVGIEIFGPTALLRSLAVDPGFRGRGLASRLTREAEDYAASQQVEALYLLTVTAEDFFAKRGYRKSSRESAPAALQETAEFRGLCPASSICMVKSLPSSRRS